MIQLFMFVKNDCFDLISFMTVFYETIIQKDDIEIYDYPQKLLKL